MTDQPQWTPGPWAVNLEDGEVYAPDGEVDPQIAYVLGENTEPEQYQADCHLIAAAPEMAGVSPRAAEMLLVAATFLRSEEPGGTVFYDGAACDAFCIADDCEAAADDIDAALAKARGQA